MIRSLFISMIQRKWTLVFILFQLSLAYLSVLFFWEVRALMHEHVTSFMEVSRFSPGETYSVFIPTSFSKEVEQPYDAFKQHLDTAQEEGLLEIGALQAREAILYDEDLDKRWNSLVHAIDPSLKAKGIYVDYSILSRVHIPLSNGSIPVSDVGQKNIPVIASSELQELFPLGKVFDLRTGADTSVTCQIVGITREKAHWIGSGVQYFRGPFVDMRGALIIPFDDRLLREESYLQSVQMENLLVFSSLPKTDVKATLLAIARKSNMTLSLTQLQDEMQEEVQRQVQFNRQNLILSLTLFGVASIGVVTSMISSIRERKHELGVRLSSGWNKKDLFLLLFAESFVLNVAAFLFAWGVSMNSSRQLPLIERAQKIKVLTSPSLLLFVAGWCLIYSIIIFIIPARWLRKLQITDFLRRDE